MTIFSVRRALTAIAAGTVLLGTIPAHSQDSFPSKPVRFIIPTAPGGNMDVLARLIADKLGQSWGQPVIVESRPGANTILATTAVARSAADGYTALFTISGFTQNLVLQPNPQYKAEDFAPVSLVAAFPIALAASTQLPANDLAGVIKLAKASPEKLTFGSYGVGSGGHVIGEGLNKAAGIKIKHVAYKGEAPAFTDLVNGSIDLAYGSMGFYGRQISGGKVKLIAVANPARLKNFPDVPTLAEAGFPGINLPGWGGVLLPVSTPAEIVEKFSKEIQRVTALPDVKEKIIGMGFEPVGSSSSDFGKQIASDVEQWGKIVRESQITLQ
ncbi:MAG: tripartite tricarboxylate transporter substrate binding protein [Porticoccaceae bacterium]